MAFLLETHALGGEILGCYPYFDLPGTRRTLGGKSSLYSGTAECFVFMVLRKISRSGYHSSPGIEASIADQCGVYLVTGVLAT